MLFRLQRHERDVADADATDVADAAYVDHQLLVLRFQARRVSARACRTGWRRSVSLAILTRHKM